MTINKFMTMTQINSICSHLINKNIPKIVLNCPINQGLTMKRIQYSNIKTLDQIRVKNYLKNQVTIITN